MFAMETRPTARARVCDPTPAWLQRRGGPAVRRPLAPSEAVPDVVIQRTSDVQPAIQEKAVTGVLQRQSDDSKSGGAHAPGGPYHPPEGVETRCSSGDDCSTLSTKINYLEHTIKRHKEWDIANPDPRYPGGRHAVEIAELEGAVSNCKAWYTTKCTNQPRFIPVPHPQGDDVKAPDTSKRVRDVMKELRLPVFLLGLVLVALLAPHPAAKLAAVLGSIAVAKTLLKRLGREPGPEA